MGSNAGGEELSAVIALAEKVGLETARQQAHAAVLRKYLRLECDIIVTHIVIGRLIILNIK